MDLYATPLSCTPSQSRLSSTGGCDMTAKFTNITYPVSTLLGQIETSIGCQATCG